MSIIPILARSIIRRKAAASGGGGGVYPLPTTTNLELWLNAQTGVITDGSGVATWEDQSGNGRDATRLDGNYQINAAALNGFNTLVSTAGSFSFSDVPLTDFSLFVVGITSARATTLGNTANSINAEVRADQNTISIYNGSISRAASTPVPVSNGIAIYEWYNNSSSIELLQNGTLALSTALSFFGTFTTIGRTSGTVRGNLEIADYILYSAALSTGDRAAIRSTLGSRYGITVS